MTEPGIIASMTGIDKSFREGEIRALHGAGLSLREGEIHGLLGENGSGKTSLIRCLAGQLTPDAGEIVFNGSKIRFRPGISLNPGIALVPQHPRLIPSLTVAHYLRICAPDVGHERDARVAAMCAELKIDLPLERPGRRVGANLVTAAVIVGALLTQPKLIILDEPTTAFTPLETAALFKFLRQLAARGTTVLLVSHKIREVHALADRLTLLRRGETVAEIAPSEVSLEEISRMLMGEGEAVVSPGTSVPGEPALTANELSLRTSEGGLEKLSFLLRRGEILAISGIRENGIDCLESILKGRLQPDAGELIIDGRKPYPGNPRDLRRAGIVIVPSDRQESGAALGLSVAENAAVLVRGDLCRRGLLERAKMNRYTNELLQEFGVAASPTAETGTLSGGMLQRLILGRELRVAKDLVILCEPAWGLDLNGRVEIYRRIVELRMRGSAVLLLASDIDEVLEIADRLIVLYAGAIAARFTRGEFERDKIGAAMLGLEPDEEVS